MSDLNFYPAVGFETAKHHISQEYCDRVQQYNTLSKPEDWNKRNWEKIISYIPIVSTIVVIYLICIGLSIDKNMHPTNHRAIKVRVIFEALSLCSLYLIPDIIATIWRNCR